jgi:hypothetical protein
VVGYYSQPRATGDIDLWISPVAENEEPLRRAFRAFGFSPQAIASIHLGPSQLFSMGVPPLRIDVMTEVSGLDFSDCYARRVDQVVEGVGVKIISKADLIRNKRSARRLKDAADLEQLSGD